MPTAAIGELDTDSEDVFGLIESLIVRLCITDEADESTASQSAPLNGAVGSELVAVAAGAGDASVTCADAAASGASSGRDCIVAIADFTFEIATGTLSSPLRDAENAFHVPGPNDTTLVLGFPDSAYVLGISNGVAKLLGELDVDKVNDFPSTPPDGPRRHRLPRGVQPCFHEAGFPCN